MIEPTMRNLWKRKVVSLLLYLVALGIHVFNVIPFMVRGWKEFLTLLGFHIGTYLVTRYGVCPFIDRKTKRKLEWGLLLYLLVFVGDVLLMALLSLASGAMEFDGWNTLHVENFWAVVLTLIGPILLGGLFFANRRHVILKLERDREKREFDKLTAEVNLLLHKLGQYRLPTHTLFATLTIIMYLSRKDPAIARSAILLLGEITRFYLIYNEETYISLAQEREPLDKLLKIYKLRFGEEAELLIKIDERVPATTKIPPGLLVNLAEGISKHGLLTDPSCPAELWIERLSSGALRIKSKNAIADPDASEDNPKRGQLTRLGETIHFLHPENRIHVWTEGHVFYVEIWLYEVFC
ncbi:hypothetical protein FAZ15_18335 [Sphingobacterium olei]|uniref:Signal transduction histidine kinase internal region domain-containing protein n=1 Tax=Sphingobacterium olei TaxID=2571155 RepID=A0A4U0NGN8_9SPHI|nr:histidine kinase [Sphingobacterium olei]TJZ53309.1 hypothetical protein FAZ15_18335 [Sphingobacterium olei]